ncbi:MAG: hypothetical protein RMM29_00225 [Planctomycetota bacterium]|nr:hypothetical protein [Planctomycetota bacterium]
MTLLDDILRDLEELQREAEPRERSREPELPSAEDVAERPPAEAPRARPAATALAPVSVRPAAPAMPATIVAPEPVAARLRQLLMDRARVRDALLLRELLGEPLAVRYWRRRRGRR